MKSIITTYPDWQMLPKGVKRMLLFSEQFYFGDAEGGPPGRSRSQVKGRGEADAKAASILGGMFAALGPAWRN